MNSNNNRKPDPKPELSEAALRSNMSYWQTVANQRAQQYAAANRRLSECYDKMAALPSRAKK